MTEHVTPDLSDEAARTLGFIDAALHQPMRRILVSKDEAKRILDERIGHLTRFGERNLPIELKRGFLRAAELTEQAAALVTMFEQRTEQAIRLAYYSPADLYRCAGHYLDRMGREAEPAASDPIQQEVTEAIAEEVGRTGGEIDLPTFIDRRFGDRPMEELTAIKFAASFVAMTRQSIGTLIEIIHFQTINSLICRGMFYRVIVQKQGGVHASAERKHVLRDEAGDAFLEVLPSFIPVIGEYLSKVKMALDLAIKMLREEAILDEAADNIETHVQIATDFLLGYQLALSTWLDWAASILGHLNELHGKLATDYEIVA